MTSLEGKEYDAAIRRLREALDEEAVSSAGAEGRQMTADEAVAFAVSEEPGVNRLLGEHPRCSAPGRRLSGSQGRSAAHRHPRPDR